MAKRPAKRRQDDKDKPSDKKKAPDFSQANHIGKIPDSVEKWLGKLGKSVPENEAFTLDGSGKEFDAEVLEDACGETFYVVYRYTELTDKACEGLNFKAFVKRGEGKARRAAQDIVDACTEDGCVAGVLVDYEKWDCNGAKAGGTKINVEIVLRVEWVGV